MNYHKRNQESNSIYNNLKEKKYLEKDLYTENH